MALPKTSWLLAIDPRRTADRDSISRALCTASSATVRTTSLLGLERAHSHAPMEPPAALGKIDGDRCEVWACTHQAHSQGPAVSANAECRLVHGFVFLYRERSRRAFQCVDSIARSEHGRHRGLPTCAIKDQVIAKQLDKPKK